MEEYVRHELLSLLRGKGNWSTYKDALAFRGFHTDLGEKDILRLLTEALEGHLRYEPKVESYSRHEECHDCDQGPHTRYAVEDGEDTWDTHCTVCDESWPCPEAGATDLESVEEDQKKYLGMFEKENRTPREESDFRRLFRRLEAVGYLPR